MTPSKGEMHSHDVDLIAAFADGSLESEEAQRLVESCADCRAEYDAQLSALAAMVALPPVSPMTDIEKAGLHRDLWTELRNPPAAASASNPWWYRWSYAAAGLFVVVGLVSVVGQLGQDDSAEPEALLAADTTAAADGGTRGYEEEAFVPLGEDSSGGTSAGEDAPAETMPTTTIAQAETTIATATDADLEAVAADARTAQITQPTTSVTITQQADDCLSGGQLAGHEVLATVELDRTYLLTVPPGTQLTEETPITIVDAATCEVVLVVE